MNRISKKALQNSFLVFVSLVSFFVVAEVVLTVQNFYLDWKYPETKLGLGLWEYDSVLGWKHRVNAEAIYANKHDRFRVPVKINSKGLRDGEYSYEKKPGVTRVLLLGDSVTAGLEVDPEKSLDGQLEYLLNGHGRYEVINAGVSGYGTDQCLLFLKNEGYKYQPDIIIYGAVFNDPVEIITIHQRGRAQGKSYFQMDENEDLILKGVPVPKFTMEDPWVMALPEAEPYYSGKVEAAQDAAKPSSLLGRIKKGFSVLRTYQWIRGRIEQGGLLEEWLVKLKLKEPSFEEVALPEQILTYQNRLMKRLFQELRDYSRSTGAQLLIYEYVNGIGEAPKRPTNTERISRELKIPYVDLADPFYEVSKGKDTLCYRHDFHWNEQGHRLAAEMIYGYLKDEEWVK